MKQLPHHIIDWLASRTISMEVITSANIGYDKGRIVIPVNTSSGNFKFNKYRKDPQDASAGPKYSYDKGGSLSLYGTEFLKGCNHIIICEGELDALALRSRGFTTVSSTGGCGSFNKDWIPKLVDYNVPIYVCYDRDMPGMQGAVNVASMIPGASIVWLPETVGNKGDVTDFLVSGGKFKDILDNAMRFPLLKDMETGASKKSLMGYKAELTNEIKQLMEVGRTVRSQYKSDEHIQVMIAKINEMITRLNYLLNRRTERQYAVDTLGMPDLTSAKLVPINKFIKFGPNGSAKCIWHDENTPSMHYYPKSNKVKCFGCGKSGDVIDVVQKLLGLSLVEAIKFLNGSK